jgi:type IV fimbrial biogenesis protein FimT
MRGFTLIELIVTMTVAAILIALAVPGMNSLAQSNRRSAEVSDLVLALNYARSEAIKQNTTTGVSIAAVGNSWASGWNVCCTSTGAVIDALPSIESRSTLSANVNGVAVTHISFNGSGTQINPAGTVLFTVCDARGAAFATAVEVNTLGHIQTGSVPGFRVDTTTALTCPGVG